MKKKRNGFLHFTFNAMFREINETKARISWILSIHTNHFIDKNKNTNFIEFYGFFSQRENFYVLGSDLQGRFYLPYSQQVVHKVYPNQIEPVDPLERAYEYLADIMYHLLHMMILNRKEWYD